MRRTAVALVTLIATLFVATPASAAPAASSPGHGGWVPAPSSPWQVPAGVRCDFAVSGEPIVDEVVKRVLTVNSDGTPKREAYTGDLVVRVTNLDTGVFFDADASGKAIIEYHADGSMTWYVVGPVVVGFAENGGSLPRGLYIIDGLYTLEISAAGYKTVTMIHGSHDSICAHIA